MEGGRVHVALLKLVNNSDVKGKAMLTIFQYGENKDNGVPGIDPIRTKILIADYILEEVSHFRYLGWDIKYEEDISDIINNY